MALLTGGKLYKMAAIRGWVSGANFRDQVVTAKRVVEDEDGPVFWIAWSGADPAQRSTFRDNLDRDQWEQIQIGDTVRMAYYDSDPYPRPYKPDGIYTSAGNFAFDIVLLASELAGCFFLARLIWKGRSRPT
jgi:hypothetical protein